MSDDAPDLFAEQPAPDLPFCEFCGTRRSSREKHPPEECSRLAAFREFCRASFARCEWPAEKSRGSVADADAAP